MHVVSSLAVAVLTQVPFSQTDPGGSDGRIWLWIALGVGALALVAGFVLAKSVIAADTGTADMQVISNAIREGAEAFLRRQYKTIGAIAAGVAIVLVVGYVVWPR